MRIVLGKKQRSSHEEFETVYQNIEDFVSRDEYETALNQAASRIRVTIGTRPAAFAWSGGKDSIALQLVCERAGLHRCVYGMTAGLEYPAALQWITAHMPDGLTVLRNDWDLAWLADHQHMLFPKDSAIAGKWFKGIQQDAQARYFRQENVAVLVLGRRWADGNYTGKGKGQIIYESKGVTRFSPIADWPHELVLAAMAYGWNATLPPFYHWPRGYRCGTHAWPARQWCRDDHHGWEEVTGIDPSIVREAASAGIDSAKQYLEARQC